MRYLPLLLLIIQWCDARVAPSETDVVSNVNTNEKVREPLNFPCTIRTLQSGDMGPSVVVRHQNKVMRFILGPSGSVQVYHDYKQPDISVLYPSSGGLSGGYVGTTAKPFSDAPVVPDDYTFKEIDEWFRNNCARPYDDAKSMYMIKT